MQALLQALERVKGLEYCLEQGAMQCPEARALSLSSPPNKAWVREGHDGTGDRVEVGPKRVALFVQLQLAKLRIPPRLFSCAV